MKTIPWAVMILLILLTAACSDDDPVVPDDDIRRIEFGGQDEVPNIVEPDESNDRAQIQWVIAYKMAVDGAQRRSVIRGLVDKYGI